MNNNLNFKVYVDGRSEEIQKHLFSLGCEWKYGENTVRMTYAPFLFIANGLVGLGKDMDDFKEDNLPELTAADVLALEPAKPTEPAKSEPQFKPFDKVLVRDDAGQEWEADFYSHSINDSHKCVSLWWRYVIPYAGNEHLCGTTDSPE